MSSVHTVRWTAAAALRTRVARCTWLSVCMLDTLLPAHSVQQASPTSRQMPAPCHRGVNPSQRYTVGSPAHLAAGVLFLSPLMLASPSAA